MRLINEHATLKRKWEQQVASSVQFDFFDQVWVQDCLHENWVYLCDAHQNPLLRIPFRRKFGVKAYLQPLFIRAFNLAPTAVTELTSFMKKKAFVHLNLTVHPHANQPQGRYQLLKWDGGIEAIRKNYATNLQRILKKGQAFEMRDISYQTFETFFRTQKGEQLQKLTPAAWSRMEKLVSEAQERRAVRCVGLFDGSELLSVGLFFFYGTRIYFMKGTLNEAGKKVGAMVHLIDAMLVSCADQYQQLDFIGSNQESIAAFYRKFGAKDATYTILKGWLPLV
jgi:hypothetical protein